MKVLVLVDGEHYPPVARWGIGVARTMGHEVVGALFLGGTEKVSGMPDLGVPMRASEDPVAGLGSALTEMDIEAVLDLSDEPVLGYRERMGLVGVALAAGVSYLGADFRFDPPASSEPLAVPAVAVIGTGKRAGKTAVAGHLARTAAAAGLNPVVVAMGRGGPPQPQVAPAGSVTVDSLLELEASGQHAASDYLEDALTSGVTTVGARRVGGGLAGAPFASNVSEAARIAVEQGAGVVILEGSGSAIPLVPWDAGVLVVPAGAPPEYLGGYLGPYRLLRSDLVVFTMARGPSFRADNLSELLSHVHRWNPDARFVVTDFVPVPMEDVRGKTVFLATTAPSIDAPEQASRLQAEHGCTVVGWSAALSDRPQLAADLAAAPDFEVLLTELKAAAVDVATKDALRRGSRVVFLDNRPVVVQGDDDIDEALSWSLELARSRRSQA